MLLRRAFLCQPFHLRHSPFFISRISRNRQTYRQTAWFVRDDQTLWTLGSVFPLPGSHVIRLPFTFQLPELLPPSFHYSGIGRLAHIGYSIEVVGHRPGIFARNRRVGRVFPLVPAADPLDVATRFDFLSGWNGEWSNTQVGDDIRQGLFGQYSRVDMEVSDFHGMLGCN